MCGSMTQAEEDLQVAIVRAIREAPHPRYIQDPTDRERQRVALNFLRKAVGAPEIASAEPRPPGSL